MAKAQTTIDTVALKYLIRAADTLNNLYSIGQVDMSRKDAMQFLKYAAVATAEVVKQKKRKGAPANIVPDEERQQFLSKERKNPNPFANNLTQDQEKN
ncbi:hypothetical protein SBM3_00049 [Synechococcus phage S-BM3]|nr:hypothetical protein SBM3_00049 [Synechococcus phage S-BM3]